MSIFVTLVDPFSGKMSIFVTLVDPFSGKMSYPPDQPPVLRD
jgi:hypothetical protein